MTKAKNIKRCTASLQLSKMQIKTTMKYHFISTRVGKNTPPLIISAVSKDEQHELSCIDSSTNLNWYNYFKNSLTLPSKVRNNHTLVPAIPFLALDNLEKLLHMYTRKRGNKQPLVEPERLQVFRCSFI